MPEANSVIGTKRTNREAAEVWSDKRNTRALMGALEAFRDVDPDLGTRAMAIFLLVALKPHQSLAEIADTLGVPTTAASRSIAALALEAGKGRPALVRVYPCREDARVSRIGLTRHGVELHRALMAAFRPKREDRLGLANP